MPTPYMHQQNGVVECENCTIVEMARNMCHDQNLDKLFWTEAVVNAVYIQNHCFIRMLDFIMLEKA